MKAVCGFAVALIAWVGASHAEARNYQEEPAVAMESLDCSVLSGTPFVCVRNPSHASITGIACTGFWGTTAMSVPGAVIPPSGSAIVKFAGKCEKTIKITKRDGTAFEITGFDVNKNTVLIVQEN
jgi:hypothetical protein